MNSSYYLFDYDKLEVRVTSEKYFSGTEEVGITFLALLEGNKHPSCFTIKFRGKAFDRAIELAQDLSDAVIQAFKKSRVDILDLKDKGGDTQKENIKGLNVLNSQNKGLTR